MFAFNISGYASEKLRVRPYKNAMKISNAFVFHFMNQEHSHVYANKEYAWENPQHVKV